MRAYSREFISQTSSKTSSSVDISFTRFKKSDITKSNMIHEEESSKDEYEDSSVEEEYWSQQTVPSMTGTNSNDDFDNDDLNMEMHGSDIQTKTHTNTETCTQIEQSIS